MGACCSHTQPLVVPPEQRPEKKPVASAVKLPSSQSALPKQATVSVRWTMDAKDNPAEQRPEKKPVATAAPLPVILPAAPSAAEAGKTTIVTKKNADKDVWKSRCENDTTERAVVEESKELEIAPAKLTQSSRSCNLGGGNNSIKPTQATSQVITVAAPMRKEVEELFYA